MGFDNGYSVLYFGVICCVVFLIVGECLGCLGCFLVFCVWGVSLLGCCCLDWVGVIMCLCLYWWGYICICWRIVWKWCCFLVDFVVYVSEGVCDGVGWIDVNCLFWF